jgi:hypothetical protein
MPTKKESKPKPAAAKRAAKPKPQPKPKAQPERGRGRPSKYTQEIVDRICYSLSLGNTRTTAATNAGVSMSTFHEWMNDFSDFSDAIKRAEEQAVEHYVNVIHAASGQTWQAAAWYLERRRPADFSKQDKVDITTNGKDINGMSVEEMLAELERIKQIKSS